MESLAEKSPIVTQERENKTEDKQVIKKKKGFLRVFFIQLSHFGPLKFVASVLRNLSWLAGLSCPVEDLGAAEAHTPALIRHCRTGKKRLRRVTRVLLSYIPYRLQSALGYPVPSSIGKTAVSEEVRCSPTKPSGKGNKRKQEDVDEEEHQSWVEALNQELGDEDSEGDPTYAPSSDGESDSEENRTHNDTESDIEEVAEEGKAIIKELDAAKAASTEGGSTGIQNREHSEQQL
ncbi:uncharacterized protein LOC121300558 [Polyodon spathula]|uniref:uncharacterized protein LOC121300558 n=1 Tax=Polyodon spathula TaxID=7913 RepID=UPI001B7E7D4A|nr:uncharacterized protein LOC121300558 [Polyodon spathula]